MRSSRAFKQELRHLPDVLARPGESWERTEVFNVGVGQTLTFHKKYEYVGTEKLGDKTLDRITGRATKAELKTRSSCRGGRQSWSRVT